MDKRNEREKSRDAFLIATSLAISFLANVITDMVGHHYGTKTSTMMNAVFLFVTILFVARFYCKYKGW